MISPSSSLHAHSFFSSSPFSCAEATHSTLTSPPSPSRFHAVGIGVQVSRPSPATARIRGEQALRPSCFLPCSRILCGRGGHFMAPLGPLLYPRILCWNKNPCLSLGHFVPTCMRFIAGGWGGWAASRPICEESPMSMGVPPAHRKVWREAPGVGSRVWSEAPMQRSIRSQESTQGCPTLRICGVDCILWSTPQSCICDHRP